jgi:ketosteroid isomerase-like protein
MATRRSQVARAIQLLSDGFARSLNTGDGEWLVRTFYAEDAHFLAPGHEMISGRAQIRDFIQGLLDAGIADLAIETTKIEASGDLAYRIGRCTLGGPSPQRGKFIEVYRRQADGSWKCVGDIFNSD